MDSHKLREDALAIFQAGVAAAEPMRAILSHLSMSGDILLAGQHRLKLNPDGRVFVVGTGKAVGPMAAAMEKILRKRLSEGVVVAKYGHGTFLQKIRLLEAGHPLPDSSGFAASKEIIRILKKTQEKDLIVCLISGGGSALLPCPPEDVPLEEKMAVTRLLIGCGATIREINAVRKHLSRLKGGGMARMAYPAPLLALILSDVVGDPLDVIASGPTVPDPTTFAQALEILERYKLMGKISEKVVNHLKKGMAGTFPETPKSDSPIFRRNINLLVGNNTKAISASAEKARQLGYHTLILSTTMTGETRHVAAVHAAMAREILTSANPVASPACLISGGETTVTIKGKGKGGRNQEFALAAALEIKELPGVLILSAGTDGTDGPTDAAGALADGFTVSRARKIGLDPIRHLENNDAYPFFKALKDLLVTGPTDTNVMDLRIVLTKK
jgi:glycerate 2-kinase